MLARQHPRKEFLAPEPPPYSTLQARGYRMKRRGPSPSPQSKSAVADFDRFVELPKPAYTRFRLGEGWGGGSGDYGTDVPWTSTPTPDPSPQGGGEKRRVGLALVTVIAMALLAGFASPAAAQSRDKMFELKLSHWVPPNHPLQKALEDWGAAVEKASGGTLKYKVFPAQQLGKAFDHYDMARDGIADLTYVNPGYQPGRFPVIAAGELPFLMSDARGGSQALDVWYRKYAAREMKDVKFCLAFIHDPGSFHSNKKIMVPSDIKGMKVRPAHATMGTFVSQLGGINV